MSDALEEAARDVAAAWQAMRAREREVLRLAGGEVLAADLDTLADVIEALTRESENE